MIISLASLIVLTFPALVIFVSFCPEYEVIESETVYPKLRQQTMYESGCDLQPDSNIFWTTKKCIGELY